MALYFVQLFYLSFLQGLLFEHDLLNVLLDEYLPCSETRVSMNESLDRAIVVPFLLGQRVYFLMDVRQRQLDLLNEVVGALSTVELVDEVFVHSEVGVVLSE